MPTVANLPGADLEVHFPSGKKKTVFLPRLLTQTINAEWQAEYGMPYPYVAKLRPTIKALREEYELDYFFDKPVRTWKDCAAVMRQIRNLIFASKLYWL
jgi:hypothetical protein